MRSVLLVCLFWSVSAFAHAESESGKSGSEIQEEKNPETRHDSPSSDEFELEDNQGSYGYESEYFEDARVSLELMGGSLTYHLVAGDAYLYSNKVSADGRLIDNLLYGIGGTFESDRHRFYTTLRLFKGNNSIGQPINGGTISFGAFLTYLHIGLIVGGYIQNDWEFYNRGIQPFSASSGSNAFVPIIGIEINPRIPLGNRYFLQLNNIITPILTNHTLSFGMYF